MMAFLIKYFKIILLVIKKNKTKNLYSRFYMLSLSYHIPWVTTMHLQVTAVDPDPEAFPIVYSVDSVVFHKHSSTVEQVKKGPKKTTFESHLQFF
jgi:hypothetical protein